MTLTPWAQAENPLQAAVEAMRREPEADGCACEYDSLPCDACFVAMLRAALPHLLRATGDQVDGEALFRLALAMEKALRKHSVAPSQDSFRWDAEPLVADLRAAFLSALAAAAGRVGG